jgi:hypothetical protein
MSELQLGLLAIGVVLVVGVFAFNRYQEGRARRTAEQTLRSTHHDVLLQPDAPRSGAAVAEKQLHSTPHGPGRSTPASALPDPRIDYVIELSFASIVSAGEVVQQWKANEHRYASRVILAVSGGAAGWRRLGADDAEPVDALRAGLQLVTRDGPVSDAELIEFRAAIETMAAAIGASVSAPEVRPVAETARELDEFCADADIQVVVHVVAADGSLPEAGIRNVAEASGMQLEADGRFTLRDAEGRLLYGLTAREGGVSLTLDVPRVPEFPRTFRSMGRFAQELAAALGGTLVDDNRNPLNERSLEAIGMQLDGVSGQFDAKGIAAGSASALRLFS